MVRLHRVLMVGLLALVACKSRRADLGMSDSAYVQVMSELKVVANATGITEALRAQRRESVLRKRGISAAQLEALVPSLTAHPVHAKELWTVIEQKALDAEKPGKR